MELTLEEDISWDSEEFKYKSSNIMLMPDYPIRGYKYGPVKLYPYPKKKFKHASESSLVPVSKIIKFLKLILSNMVLKSIIQTS